MIFFLPPLLRVTPSPYISVKKLNNPLAETPYADRAEGRALLTYPSSHPLRPYLFKVIIIVGKTI
jgi:hypothetical protein